jgi:hypothetical protein
MFNRDLYFNYVREVLFEGALTQQQVDGQNVLLGLWEQQQTGTPMDDLRWLAYILATTFHETGFRMWPIEEYGRGAGKSYGNVDPETGEIYFGRGFVQLTWKENYANASAALGLVDDRDLVKFPHVALDSLIAGRILFRGMAEGWFTGAKLGQFFNDLEDDPVEARTIVNGHDCDAQIAAYHDQFLAALKESEVLEGRPSIINIVTDKRTSIIVNGEEVYW